MPPFGSHHTATLTYHLGRKGPSTCLVSQKHIFLSAEMLAKVYVEGSLFAIICFNSMMRYDQSLRCSASRSINYFSGTARGPSSMVVALLGELLLHPISGVFSPRAGDLEILLQLPVLKLVLTRVSAAAPAPHTAVRSPRRPLRSLLPKPLPPALLSMQAYKPTKTHINKHKRAPTNTHTHNIYTHNIYTQTTTRNACSHAEMPCPSPRRTCFITLRRDSRLGTALSKPHFVAGELPFPSFRNGTCGNSSLIF